MTRIKGVKNWYCSLETKEKFGMRPLAAASYSGCSLWIPGGLWMVAISWWALDGCGYFLEGCG